MTESAVRAAFPSVISAAATALYLVACSVVMLAASRTARRARPAGMDSEMAGFAVEPATALEIGVP